MNSSVLIFALFLSGAQDANQPTPAALPKRSTFKAPGREGRVAFSPDGTRLAGAGGDGRLRAWDLTKETEIFAIEDPKQYWTRIAFSADGMHLVVGGLQGAVRVLDSVKGATVSDLERYSGYIDLIRFLDDGKTLVVGDSDGNVHFWDFASRRKLPDRDLSVGKDSHLAITPDGKTLVTSRFVKNNYVLDLWDTAARKKTMTIDSLEGDAQHDAISADGKILVLAGRDGVRICDVAAKKVRATLIGQDEEIIDTIITPDGKSVITGGADNRVKIWDIASGGERLTLVGARSGGAAASVAVSADGKRIAAGQIGFVSVWQLSQTASAFESRLVKAKAKKKAPPEISDKEQRAIDEEAEALAQQGAKGAAALAKKLRDGHEAWKFAALRALSSMSAEAEPALDAIMQELRSENLELKHCAVEAIQAIGPNARRAIPEIIKAAKETGDFNSSFRAGGSSNVAEAAIQAVRTLDPDALPRLADAMIPGLLHLVEEGRLRSIPNALAVLRQLGPHAKPALPRLRDSIAELPDRIAADVSPIFQAVGEDGIAMLADYLLDPKTPTEMKLILLDDFRWNRQHSPAGVRILRACLEEKSLPLRMKALETLRYVPAKELIPKLVELLPDRDIVNVGYEKESYDPYLVAGALAGQGKDAVPVLIKALEHDEPMARFQATRALGLIGKKATDARIPLEARLKDEVPLIGIEAATALLRQGKVHDKALAQIEKHLRPDDKLFGAALAGTREAGAMGRPLLPAVKRLVLDAKDLLAKHSGFSTFRKMGADAKEVVHLWVELVKESPTFLGRGIGDEIREYPKEAHAALPAILKYLKDENQFARNDAMEALAAMGPYAKDALPDLIKLLTDGSERDRSEVLAPIGAIGVDAKPAVPRLLQWYEELQRERVKENTKEKKRGSEGSYHMGQILNTLGGIGPGAVDAVPKLIEWLPDDVRVARTLGKIGPDAKEAVPALQKRYQEGTTHEKAFCAFALFRITGKTGYVAELADVLQKSKEWYVRLEVIELLNDLGADARPALPALLAVAKDKSKIRREGPGRDVQEEAVKALRHFGADAKAAIPELIDMLKSGSYRGRAAIQTLGAMGPAAQEAIPALEQFAEEFERFLPDVQRALAKIRVKP